MTQGSDADRLHTIGFGVTLSLRLFKYNQGQIAVARATRAVLRETYQARLDQAVNQAHKLQQQPRNGFGTMKILLIEDDHKTTTYIVRGLCEKSHRVDHRVSGRDGLFLASKHVYDVVIVDRMLPAMDGLSAVTAMRAAKVETPILFLTALDGIDDRVEGLEAGGDDYLIKPFALSELLARIHALARRSTQVANRHLLQVADLEIDLFQRTVRRGDIPVDLQPREFQLLEYLIRNADQIVTRAMLLENVWGYYFDPKTNIVETHISRLRAKIDRGHDVALIQTVRGAGYRLHAAP